MATFRQAMDWLRPGYIAKTPDMRGYMRRTPVASRVVNTGDDAATKPYIYKNAQGTEITKSAGLALLELPSETIGIAVSHDRDAYSSAPDAGYYPDPAGIGSPGYEFVADMVFDLELVENPNWVNSYDSDSKAVYVIRCWQVGGTETSSGDLRKYRVCTVSNTSDTGTSPTATPRPLSTTDSLPGDLVLDGQTLEIMLSGDWEVNQVTEATYVASSTSSARW